MRFDNELWAERARRFELESQKNIEKQTESTNEMKSAVDMSILDQFIPGEKQLQANPATT